MSQLVIGHLDRLGDNGAVVGRYDLRSNEELLIGRDGKSCQIHLEALWISNRHFRIYSIVYDTETEPFVYAEDLSSNGNNTWLYKREQYWESCLMSKGTTFLLSHRNKLRLCDGTMLIYHCDWISQKSASPEEVDELRKLEIQSFGSCFYLSERKLGVGGYATVFMAVDRWKDRQLACKVVKLKRRAVGDHTSLYFKNPQQTHPFGHLVASPQKCDAEKLWREVKLLKSISHPNIVQLHRVFYSKSTLYIIEDLLTGGDLSSYIAQEGSCLEEEDACNKVYQIIKALEYLHDKAIVHRDLKPENVLLSVPSVSARIVLTDFGGATGNLRAGVRRLKSLCGTAGYIAPEIGGNNRRVLRAGYTSAVDMWSLGCLTTALFIGQSYFTPTSSVHDARKSSEIIRAAAATCDLSRLDHGSEWSAVNSRVKDFIKSCLSLDETERPTAKEALLHHWFSAGYCKGNSRRQYEDIIKGWKPVQPAEDFAEDLRLGIDATIPKNDIRRRLLSWQPQKKKINDQPSSTAKAQGHEDFARPDAGVRASAVVERQDNFAFDFRAATKRRRSTSGDDEDHAIREAAWEENRGLISAKTYATRIGNLRREKAQKKA